MSKNEIFSRCRPAKSMSKVQNRVNIQSAIERADVRRVAFLRESLCSSLKYAVNTSWNEIVEVSEAKISRMKNTPDQSSANGISLKISGSVMKISDAPSAGSRPALNTAGKITKPAKIATNSVSSATLNEVPVRLLFDLKYEA